ncbi:MAG: type II secretion system protein [Phycisphaerales bacterium]|nr:type II secretion system protein [Phycisphaerales bacterium]
MNTPKPHPVGSASIRRGAFTLIEVLVVLVIAMVLLTISVPAFQSLIESSERSLAVNSVQTAIQAAQDIALDGREGEDGAIVFLVADNGQLTMVPAVKIGTHREPYAAAPGALGLQTFDYDYIDMEVFAPLNSADAIQLPKSWFVRGYAPIGSMVDKFIVRNTPADQRFAAIWYNSPIYGGTDFNSDIKQESHWIFPETNMFAKNAQHVGGNASTGDLGGIQGQFRSPRQSFMIRFDGRTGQLSRSTAPAIFIDPRVSRERPFGDQPNLNDRWKRVDLADSVQRWGLRMMSASDTNSDGTHWTIQDQYDRALWMGNISHDTVLVKAVSRIALYNEQEMARDIGARGLNRITGTVYRDYDQTDSESEIQFDDRLWDSYPGDADILRKINRWVEGDTNDDGIITFDSNDPNLLDEPLSRLYLIQPYSGKLQEVLR